MNALSILPNRLSARFVLRNRDLVLLLLLLAEKLFASKLDSWKSSTISFVSSPFP